MMNNSLLYNVILCLFSACLAVSSYAKNWFPLSVDVWEPAFNETRTRLIKQYIPLKKAKEEWKICVSIPHLKDAYWLVVNFALIEEAKRLGIRLRINEAGGYNHLKLQREQVQRCMKSGADGLILSANDATGLNDLVNQYKQEGKPVIDMINGINSSDITGRAAVTYYDNAQIVAQYLKKIVGDKSKNVLWLPGPKGPKWALSANKGFHNELENSNIVIRDTLWGDTDKEVQTNLIKTALNDYKDIDYIVGTTVSSDAAVNLLNRMKLDKKVGVLSYYYDPSVHKNLIRGHIISAASDKQALQAKLALDMAVRALEGSLIIKHAGPIVTIIDQNNLRKFDSNTSIPPKGFRPVFSYNDWVNEN